MIFTGNKQIPVFSLPRHFWFDQSSSQYILLYDVLKQTFLLHETNLQLWIGVVSNKSTKNLTFQSPYLFKFKRIITIPKTPSSVPSSFNVATNYSPSLVTWGDTIIVHNTLCPFQINIRYFSFVTEVISQIWKMEHHHNQMISSSMKFVTTRLSNIEFIKKITTNKVLEHANQVVISR